MSNYDPWNVKQIAQTYWVQLKAQGSWTNQATSNKFNVTFEPATPPSVTNTFEVQVYQGHYTEVELPAYLFKSSITSQLNYQSSSWVGINSIDVITQIRNSTSSSGKSLFVKAYTSEGWQVSITATDASWQTAEVLVTIKVLRWASKAWVECDGPYESNWLKCADNLVLESDSRMWLASSTFSVFSVSSIYKICGLICFIVILIHSVLWVRYGYSMLELAVHSQSLTLMVVSSDNISSRWIEYLSWLKYFKFDFSFINDIFGVKPIMCTESADKLLVLGFQWEETLLNYQNLIIILLICLSLIYALKYVKNLQNLLSKLLATVPHGSILWTVCLRILLPIACINLMYELTRFYLHVLWSSAAVLCIVAILTYLIVKKCFFVKVEFVSKVDECNSLLFSYLNFAIELPYILLFGVTSKFLWGMLMVLILMIQSSIIYNQIFYKVKLAKHKIFAKATAMFGNAIMLLIAMLMTVQKVNVWIAVKHNSI